MGANEENQRTFLQFCPTARINLQNFSTFLLLLELKWNDQSMQIKPTKNADCCCYPYGMDVVHLILHNNISKTVIIQLNNCFT